MLSRLIPLVIFFPAIAPAISKEMQELMRDVALLQQQVKDLQQSQDNKFTALTVMVQQTLDSATKTNTAVAVLESRLSSTATAVLVLVALSKDCCTITVSAVNLLSCDCCRSFTCCCSRATSRINSCISLLM